MERREDSLFCREDQKVKSRIAVRGDISVEFNWKLYSNKQHMEEQQRRAVLSTSLLLAAGG